MSTDVNAAVTTWNSEHAAAEAELAALELTLKADYIKYVDSLAAYVQRLKAANDVRAGYLNVLGIEDVSNSTKTRVQFLYSAELPIENKAVQYLLDRCMDGRVTMSKVIVDSGNAAALLERKSLPG